MQQYISFAAVSFLLLGCGDNVTPVSECVSKNLFVEITKTTGADCGISAGQIIVNAGGSMGSIRYQLGDGAFQTSNIFNAVKPGAYIVTAKDENDCSASVSVVVKSGISFQTSVKPIIEENCAIPTCHDGSGNSDFRIFENLTRNASEVKARTQSGNMPKIGSLTPDEIQKIACWVDDGALNN